MILSGGIAFIWVDPRQGGGWTWPEVYRAMAALHGRRGGRSRRCSLPRLVDAPRPASVARNDVLGFLAVAAAVARRLRRHALRASSPLARALRRAAVRGAAASPAPLQRALGRPGRAVRRHRLHAAAGRLGGAAGALRDLPRRPAQLLLAARAPAPFLAFIVLYKLGDAFAGSLLTPFLLQAMHYSTAEVGVVNKVIGLWLTIGGALIGGALMIRLGLWRALMLFGILQMLGNLGFWWLAVHGRGALPGLVHPGVRLGLRQARRSRRRSTAAC